MPTLAAMSSVSSVEVMKRRSTVRYLVLLGLLAALVMLQSRLWFGDGSLRDGMLLQQKVEQLKQQNATLKKRNQLKAADVYALKHGNKKVEEIARKDLGMIKQGEVFYQILKQKNGQTPHD